MTEMAILQKAGGISMSFAEVINSYAEKYTLSSKNISVACGLSPSAISRYRSGLRIPKKDSGYIDIISEGIVKAAYIKGYYIDMDEIKSELIKTLNNYDSAKNLSVNLNTIIGVLNININELARSLNFDPSYISKIRNGSRHPSDVSSFAGSLAKYIILKYSTEKDLDIIEKLTNINFTNLRSDEITAKLSGWLLEFPGYEERDDILKFLENIDQFDLNQYMKSTRFNDIKTPKNPLPLHSTKTYHGIEEVKKGHLDFLKTNILSKSKSDVFIYSELPIEEMASDMNFNKTWMMGLSMLLKEGRKINMVHDINRPLKEMLLGFESWIPLYMTGLMNSFYFKDRKDNLIRSTIFSSDSCAMVGNCIKDSFNDTVNVTVTTSENEVIHIKKETDALLNRAQVLIRPFGKSNKKLMMSFLASDCSKPGKRIGIFTAPPLYTADGELIEEILSGSKLNEEEKDEIRNFRLELLKIVDKALEKSILENHVSVCSKEDFNMAHIYVPISGAFIDNTIEYTYDQYLRHIELTKHFSEEHPGYRCTCSDEKGFRNIQIQIREGKWAIISKSAAPTIHFYINQPKLLKVLESMCLPSTTK
jgi:transcriptional regulator with XRE-family HTH domain